MALVQVSMDSGYGPSLAEDPFDWTVEQVVYTLCSLDSPILASRAISSLIDRDGFAKILRDEQIDGEALLTVVTLDSLRNDLGVKALGVRAKLINLIERLQQQSSRYQQKLERNFVSEGRLSSTGMSQYNTPYLRSPERQNIVGPNLFSGWNYGLPGPNTLLDRGPVPQLSPAAADVRQVQDVSGDDCQTPIAGHECSVTLSTTPGRETHFTDEHGRRRRRLAPTALGAASSTIQAEPVDCAGEDAPQGLHNPKENNDDRVEVQHLDCRKQQRNRIQPTHIIQPADDTLASDVAATSRSSAIDFLGSLPIPTQSSLGKRAQRKTDQIYFGPSAINVDDIFYSDTALGNTIQNPNQSLTTKQQELFFGCSAQASDAQRLWVNSRMNYFFRSTTVNLKIRGGGKTIGIIPYPDRLGQRNRPLSMTLISQDALDISTSRVNRSEWYRTSSLTKATKTSQTSNSFNVRDPAMAVDDDNGDWDALEKWKYRDDDVVLPVYGESGSEGEYDLDTWHEMEAEGGEIARTEVRSTGRKLTSVEIEDVLKSAIRNFRIGWQTQQRLKIQYKAWPYWAKARRDRTIEIQANNVRERIGELEVRTSKLRHEIFKEEWSRADQVFRQSKIMQPSIFEQEECQWRLDILNSRIAPEKLPPASRKPHRIRHDTPPLQEGEEDLETESNPSEGEFNNDALDDFIVDDEINDNSGQLPQEEEDMIMADDEDAVDSETLVMPLNHNSILNQQSSSHLETSSKPAMQHSLASADAPNFIDLTQDPDPSSSPAPKQASTRIVTPPIIHTDEGSDAWFKNSRDKKPVFKHPPTVGTVPVVDLDTESDKPMMLEATPSLPPHDKVDSIRRLSPTYLIEKQDRRRLLVWLIAHADKCIREQTLQFVDDLPMEDCREHVKAGLKRLKAERDLDWNGSESIMQVAAWYVGWTIPVKLDSRGIEIKHIKTTLKSDEGFAEFHGYMLEYLKPYKQSSRTKSTPSKRKKEGYKKKGVNADPTDSSSSVGPRKLASESQETIQKRDTALQRMREDRQRAEQRAQREARQRELMPRLYAMSTMRQESSEVTLNPGKLDQQDFIKLNPEFGRGAQLKPHQKDGLQFMWREITGDHEDLQGCLLAQTMGLGKTIQVIALLVAISDAANSPNEGIRSQVSKLSFPRRSSRFLARWIGGSRDRAVDV